jgi:4-amino-4-deoxy-L-arabinose transferase-like glycosyltransferase
MGRTERELPRLLVLSVAAAALATLLWRVAVEPLDWGYIRYLGIADEIVRSGDWVVLRLVDRIYLLKPPLFMWLLAAPSALLGAIPYWVPHWPNLLGLVLSLVCVHRLAASIYGRGDPPLAGALLFATTWETFNQVTAKRLDPLFAALVTAGLTLFFLGATALQESRRRQLLLGASWVLIALATLTKGPHAVAFFVGITAAWAATTRRLRVFTEPGNLVGLALLGGLCAIWPLLLAERLGYGEALRDFGREQFMTRTGAFLLYARSLPVQQLPWSLFFPALGVWLYQRRPWRGNDGIAFLLLWVGVLFAELHLASARHQRYLQPATPGFPLLLLLLWYAPGGGPADLEGWPARLRGWVSALCFGTLAVGGGVGCVWFALFDHDPFFGRPIPIERWLAAPIALGIGLGALAAARSLARGGLARRSPLPLALLLLGVLTIFSLLAGGELRAQDPMPIARESLTPIREGQPGALLGLFEEQRQLTRLLAGRPVPLLANAEAAAAWARSQPGGRGLLVSDAASRRALAALPGLEIRIVQEFVLAQVPVELLEIRAGT